MRILVSLPSFLRRIGVFPLLVGFIAVVGTAGLTAQPLTVHRFVGNFGGPGFDDGIGTGARFNVPYGVALDGAGNVIVADSGNNTIRRIAPGGLVWTLAGQPAAPAGSADGPGATAFFNGPRGTAVDPVSGNIYVADASNYTIRMVTPSGMVSTIAGLAGASGSTDGIGSNARFGFPSGLALDNAGNLFVADWGNDTIRKIVLSTGAVTTVAGLAGVAGSTDGTGSSALFNAPLGIVFDPVTNFLFISDRFNNTIRKMNRTTFAVTTVAGSAGVSGTADGSGANARFNSPYGITLDPGGALFVSDMNSHTIRRITAPATSPLVSTFAGVPGAFGSADGGSTARFNYPGHLGADSVGGVYVADSGNNAIRYITNTGVTSTVAGMAASPAGSADGTGSAARFSGPAGVAFDSSGNAYVADSLNQTIRKVTPAGVVTTLAGSAGVAGTVDGVGSGARFNAPVGVAVDGGSNVYVADALNHSIRKVTPGGVVTTIAGLSGTAGYAEGVGSSARFNTPNGVCFGTDGNLYVADTGNHVIRKITLGGVASTSLFAGVPSTAGSNDGSTLTAKFNTPLSVVQDGSGTVYVADYDNNTIRLITGGSVGTLAGSAGVSGTSDGAGTGARFYSPTGLALQPGTGHLLVTDYNRVRRVRPDSVVTTVLGSVLNPLQYGYTDGTGVFVQFNQAFGIAVSSAGAICISDYFNSAVRRAFPAPATDFDGDGRTDIVWRNTSTGEDAIWYMNGLLLTGGGGFGSAPTAWKIVGEGDFNSDGVPDIVWRNTSTGENAIWYMGGAGGLTVIGGGAFGSAPTNWSIVGIADFNNDSTPDIVWRNTTTGENAIWYLGAGGLAVIGGGAFGSAPPVWAIVGVGDFNGDGQPDIVWRNTSTGEDAIWFMSGTSVIGGGAIGSAPTAWSIAGVGDFNGDGSPDIVWRNTSTGEDAIWFMKGLMVFAGGAFGSAPTAWSIVGP